MKNDLVYLVDNYSHEQRENYWLSLFGKTGPKEEYEGYFDGDHLNDFPTFGFDETFTKYAICKYGNPYRFMREVKKLFGDENGRIEKEFLHYKLSVSPESCYELAGITKKNEVKNGN